MVGPVGTLAAHPPSEEWVTHPGKLQLGLWADLKASQGTEMGGPFLIHSPKSNFSRVGDPLFGRRMGAASRHVPP